AEQVVGLPELRHAFARPRAPGVTGRRRLRGVGLQHRDVEAVAGQHHRGAQADDATAANDDRAQRPVTLRADPYSPRPIWSIQTATARISASSWPGAISMPYVSRTRNHRFETSATCSPSRSILNSWSTTLPFASRSSPPSTSIE